MTKFKLPTVAITLFALVGCIAQFQLSPNELQSKIQRSPFVASVISKSKFEERVSADAIEVFYKSWSNPLTRPDAIVNWEHYFVISQPSSPTWKYTEIMAIEHYQKTIDDQSALIALKKLATKNGGDAIIDVYREPVSSGQRMPTGVIGDAYKAVVVRKI